jgi:hypothetical protein
MLIAAEGDLTDEEVKASIFFCQYHFPA